MNIIIIRYLPHLSKKCKNALMFDGLFMNRYLKKKKKKKKKERDWTS